MISVAVLLEKLALRVHNHFHVAKIRFLCRLVRLTVFMDRIARVIKIFVQIVSGGVEELKALIGLYVIVGTPGRNLVPISVPV